MPYIAIKSYPKDEETKKIVAEKINQVFLEVWGCPQEAISISIEEFKPEDWKAKVYDTEMQESMEHMVMLSGKKIEK